MFITQLFVGILLVILTVIIHAIALDITLSYLEKWGPIIYRRLYKSLWRISMLILAVLMVFAAHIVQIWLWAAFYYYATNLPDFETSLYFSTATFTTVGYGDVTLDAHWRLLSSFQSANGLLLFGWSTAFIFEIMSQLYKNDQIKKHRT